MKKIIKKSVGQRELLCDAKAFVKKQINQLQSKYPLIHFRYKCYKESHIHAVSYKGDPESKLMDWEIVLFNEQRVFGDKFKKELLVFFAEGTAPLLEFEHADYESKPDDGCHIAFEGASHGEFKGKVKRCYHHYANLSAKNSEVNSNILEFESKIKYGFKIFLELKESVITSPSSLDNTRFWETEEDSENFVFAV